MVIDGNSTRKQEAQLLQRRSAAQQQLATVVFAHVFIRLNSPIVTHLYIYIEVVVFTTSRDALRQPPPV